MLAVVSICMRILRCLVLALSFSSLGICETPQEIAYRILTSHSPEEVLACLPKKFREALRDVTPQEKARLFEEFSLQLSSDRIQIQSGTEPNELVTVTIHKEGPEEQKVHVFNDRLLMDGEGALLRLLVCEDEKRGENCVAVLAWFEVEDGTWVLSRLETTADRSISFADGSMLHRFKRNSDPVQAVAIGRMRTLNTANITYYSTYEKGYAPSIRSLGPAETCNEDNACLIDERLAAADDQSLDGYRFHYELSSGCGQEACYRITARPVDGKGPSFYTDERGIIYSTDEDRDATPQDPPLG